MKRIIPESNETKKLRYKAELLLDSCTDEMALITGLKEEEPVSQNSTLDTDELLNELSIHQIELELQNEELRQKQIALEKLERRYFKHYDLASVGLLLLDSNGWILDANIIAAEMLGLKQRHAINRPLLFISYILPRWQEIFQEHLDSVLFHNDKQTCEVRIASRLGKEIDVIIQSCIYFNEQENKEIYINLTDVTHLKKLTNQLEEKNNLLHRRTQELENANQQLIESKNVVEYLATHDVLTTLPNRVYFMQEFNNILERKSAIPFAIFFIDLDNFKYINDTFGHDIGDLLLEKSADRIRKTLPSPHFTARFGGDEFVALVHETDEYHLRQLAQLVLNNLIKVLYLKGHEISISCSIGVSRFPIDGKTSTALLKNADTAMYLAKHSGKNNVNFFTVETSMDVNDINLIKFTMKHAFAENRFKLVFQPQFDLNTKEIVRFEALIRLHDPQGNVIYPEKFIQIAEDIGIMVTITYWVVEEVCLLLYSFQQRHEKLPSISINLSTKCFSQPDFAFQLKKILDKYQISPELIMLEIKENRAFFSQSYLSHIWVELKDLGFQLCLDDFGQQELSLNYLKQIPIDQVKLHGTLIQSIETENIQQKMVATLIQYLHTLSYKVTAESIEYAAQAALLQSFGCDFGQGYYLGRPEEKEILFNFNRKIN